MESVRLLCDGDLFDKVVREGLPEGRDLTVVVKDSATDGGWPAVVITFTVELPNGVHARAQAVTTARAFMAAAAGVKGRCELLGLNP